MFCPNLCPNSKRDYYTLRVIFARRMPSVRYEVDFITSASEESHRLLDGVGTTGVFTEGPQMTDLNNGTNNYNSNNKTTDNDIVIVIIMI